MMQRLIQWLDDRTGCAGWARRFLYESIPGGPKWRHTWRGAALLFLPPGRHRFLPVDRLQPQRPDGLGERLFHSV